MLRSLLALVIFALTAGAVSATITNEDLSRNPKIQTIQIEALIDEVFDDYSRNEKRIIAAIFDCESGGKNQRGGPNGLITHVDLNGEVVTNKSSGATGAGQIIKKFHRESFWARQKLDPSKVYENLLYTKALIDDKRDRGHKNIFSDWKASEKCWKQPRPNVVASS